MRQVTVSSLGLLLSLAAFAGEADAPGHAARETRSPAEWAKVFDAADRVEWQKPITVYSFLGLGPGMKIADLGAGTGYFTRLLSALVEEQGVVYAVDTDPAMLDYIRGREDIETKDNLRFILAEPDDPKLPSEELDVILVLNTWHHIDRRGEYLKHLRGALRPGRGRVAIIDWQKFELPLGPPVKEKLDRDQVVAEFERAGWTLISESVALPYQYFLVFAPQS